MLKIQRDKQLHFIVSFVMTLVISCFLPIFYAGFIALAIGVLKEVYDRYKVNPTGFCFKDLLADAIGIILAIIILILFKGGC